MTKKVFLKMISKGMNKKEVIILTSQLGDIKVLSQKKKPYAKGYSVTIPINIFKNQDSIHDLINCKLIGIVICDNKYLNEQLQKQFKEVQR